MPNRRDQVYRLVILAPFAVFLLGSCASNSGEVPAAPLHYLEQNAINALQQDHNAEGAALIHLALNNALNHYRRLDDLAGQWRMHLLLAQDALRHHPRNAGTLDAREHALALSRLASMLDSAEYHYQTALILGRLDDQESEFRRALRHARTPLEKAVALTYLNENQQALDLLDTQAVDAPAERAFVYYRYALATTDQQAYRRSLHYYRLAADSQGIADALMRLALLAGNSTDARGYAERALVVLTAVGDQDKALAVDAWLKGLDQ